MKTIVYVDGLNLYYSMLRGTPFKWLDLYTLFRDQVLPALPREIQANIDEEEYLATKIRLLESLERCLSKHPAGGQ